MDAHDKQRRFAAGTHKTGQRRAVALGIREEGEKRGKEGKELDQREHRPLDRQVLHGDEQRQPEECHEVSVRTAGQVSGQRQPEEVAGDEVGQTLESYVDHE